MNFSTISGELVSGDILVLDLNNDNVTIDTTTSCSTPITIALESPANASTETSDTTPDFVFNATDNSATLNCTLFINSSTGDTASYANNVSVLNATSTTLTANATLAKGDYTWWISCSDDSSAPVITYESTQRLLTINIAAATTTSTPSASGTGGGEYPLFRPKDDKMNDGYEEIMYEDWRVTFNVGDEAHRFKLEEVSKTTAKISISSERQEATLSVGQEKRFSISGDNYYDLLVRLNSIGSPYKGRLGANITIKTIHEEIIPPWKNVTIWRNSTNPETLSKKENISEEVKDPKLSGILIVIIILALLVVGYKKVKTFSY